MTSDDSQILAEVNYAVDNDRRIRDEIKKAVDSHDRVFFERMVSHVLAHLHPPIVDFKRLIDTAYEWFKLEAFGKEHPYDFR